MPKSAVRAICRAALDAAEDPVTAADTPGDGAIDATTEQPLRSVTMSANRYRNSADVALQGVMLEPPILQMEGIPGWQRIEPEQYAQDMLRRGIQPDGDMLKLLLRNTEVTLSNRGEASVS